MNEERAIAIMLANLKGGKKKPSNLIEFAKACRALRNNWKGGFNEMSEFFKVSQYMLRQIDKINDLDEETKKLVHSHRLGIDASYQLWRIDAQRRKDAMTIIPYLTTEEIRSFVNLLHKFPKKSVDECKKEFEKHRDKNVHILILPLPSEDFKQLSISAKEEKMSVHDFTLKIIKKSIRS